MSDAQPDVVVIGAGPAGLSAGLNLVRQRRSVVLVDTNRPRHAPTLRSHGTLGLDGVPPLELRRIGREQFLAYPGASHVSGRVHSVNSELVVDVEGLRGAPDVLLRPRAVLVATGLSEVLPDVANLRAYYGTALHSCVECDGYEKSGERLALIGESDDLAARALEISHVAGETGGLTVFTNGVGLVSEADEAALGGRGVRVIREPIAEIAGERAVMGGVRLASGELVPATAGFVRPQWVPQTGFLTAAGVALADDGGVEVDAAFRASVAGIYAAGDVTAREALQIAVAAGEGAVVARTIHRDLLAADAR